MLHVWTETLVCCRAVSAPRLPPQSESWQSPVCCYDFSPLTVLVRLLLFLSSVSFCAYFDWLSRLFQFATWQYTDVHQLSVQKWLFNNTVVLFPPKSTQGPVGHYRAITSEILVWTSGRKLMCWCDERFSLWVVQKEQVREDQSQISSCEFRLLLFVAHWAGNGSVFELHGAFVENSTKELQQRCLWLILKYKRQVKIMMNAPIN